jgi:hypothetical protein
MESKAIFESARSRVSAQAKPISEVVKDFEQSLGNLRPSTKRVYVAGTKAAIRAASLELWQSPSTTDLLASIGKSPIEKRARISPFLDFLSDRGSKQSVSDEEIVALRNLVIQTIANGVSPTKVRKVPQKCVLGLTSRNGQNAEYNKMRSKLKGSILG